MFEFLRRIANRLTREPTRPTVRPVEEREPDGRDLDARAMASEVVQRTLEALRDPDPGIQCLALNEFFALPAGSVSDADRQAVMTAAVAALEIGIRPMFTAERLVRFGEEVVPSVADLIRNTSSPEARILAALIMLRFGSRLGLPVLLKEIEEEGEYLFIASYALRDSGCAEHVPFLVDQLRRAPAPSNERLPPDVDLATLSLLGVLADLRAPLPEDLWCKFSDPQASDYFRKMFEKHGFLGPDA